MSLSHKEKALLKARLKERIASLSPDERALLRELAAEKPKRPTTLPKRKPKIEEPPLELRKSFNGTWVNRGRR